MSKDSALLSDKDEFDDVELSTEGLQNLRDIVRGTLHYMYGPSKWRGLFLIDSLMATDQIKNRKRKL